MVDNTGSKIPPFVCAQTYCLKIETHVLFLKILLKKLTTFIEQYVLRILAIGHLHDGIILLLRPESFSFFLSYLNLVIPVRVKQQKSRFAQESKTLKDSGRSSKMTSSCKCPILHAVQFLSKIQLFRLRIADNAIVLVHY